MYPAAIAYARTLLAWDLGAILRPSGQAACDRLQHCADAVARIELQEQARDMILHPAFATE